MRGGDAAGSGVPDPARSSACGGGSANTLLCGLAGLSAGNNGRLRRGGTGVTDLTAQGEFDLPDPANAPLQSPFGSSRRGARGLLTAIAVAVILTAALCLGISHVRYERAAEAQLQAALQT